MITMWNKNGVRYLELDDQNVIIVIKLMRCVTQLCYVDLFECRKTRL